MNLTITQDPEKSWVIDITRRAKEQNIPIFQLASLYDHRVLSKLVQQYPGSSKP